MPIIEVKDQIKEIENGLKGIKMELENPLIKEPFTKDFAYRLCWSSNAIEGNTLNLEETVSVIEYDEVKSGHTYTEYQEAKNLYRAIVEKLLPLEKRKITEAWLKETNGIIRGMESEYRKNPVYIGTIVEAVYYPPGPDKVPDLMKEFIQAAEFTAESAKDILEEIARQHIRFERIHPFQDGNGRAGRILLNQQLLNHGLLPLVIEPKGKYRQAFRQYEKNGDLSLMTHVLCKGELESMKRVRQLAEMIIRQTEHLR